MIKNNYSFLNKILTNFGESDDAPKIPKTPKNLDEINRQYFEDEPDFDLENNNITLEKEDIDMQKISIDDSPNFFDYFNFSNFFSQDTNKMKSSQQKSGKDDLKFSFITELKKTISDPLGIIILLMVSIFTYIYFASELICQALGLFYPAYYMYTLIPCPRNGRLESQQSRELLHFKSPQKSIKIKSIMKYFIIYSHLELITSLTRIVGFYFTHLKILVIISILYMAGYRQDWLSDVYERILMYDKIIFNAGCSNLQKIHQEYTKMSTETTSKKVKS